MIKSRTSTRSEAPLTPGPLPLKPHQARGDRSPQPPTSFVAQALLEPAVRAGASGVIYLASSERRADEIARALRHLAPEIEVLNLPPWDCLPYDRTSPSRECMGRRMAVLAAMDQPTSGPRVLVVSPEALLQRLPPASVVSACQFLIAPGLVLDRDRLEAFAASAGYVFDERIDEPGEIAILGEVVDIFPASASAPVRVRLGPEDEVLEVTHFDPLTQRSDEALDQILLGPASELILRPDAIRSPGDEHRAPEIYEAAMRTVLDLAPQAVVGADPRSFARLAEVQAQIDEAYQSHKTLGASEATAPSKLYLTARSAAAALRRRTQFELQADQVAAVPNFALARNPGRAFASKVDEWLGAGRRVVLAGLAQEQRPLARALKRGLGREAVAASGWSEALEGDLADVRMLTADLETGFDDPASALTIIAASDVLGGRVAAQSSAGMPSLLADPDLRPGDVAIHEDHGLGLVAGLERLDVAGVERDALRLTYHGEASLLVPVEDLDKVWRYGSEAEAVSLDRLHTDAWAKRRAALSRDIDASAAHLVALAKARAAARAPKLSPPKAAYARFAARFPYPETADQAAAIEAVLADLASGKIMQRLVCGDVGFGKTEIALRAAAAAALCGRQVAVVAPTTVLARQHFETFQRRFAGTGVVVAQLSRLVSPAQARSVKAGLADGSIGVVVGTHAIAGAASDFRDLGLLIIDEEQRFGAKLKADFAAMGQGAHRLTLTATPIPRTLQMALVGVEDVNVIATPPARRRPIRTFLAPFDPATVRTALLRERRRGGQSFVVAPRISDIGWLKDELERLCPELKVRVAHGELPPEQVDETMVGFSSGDGDVLLATNIIESGLDVPRANTMLVWRADLFGLAQLHQLRGRVGRGRAQGVTYLLHDPATPLSDVTRARLGTLEAFDRLGSGLAISAQDLEIRGAGDLTGEEQAGHVRLIGTALYQRLLISAVRAAKGDADMTSVRPELNLGLSGSLPEAYVPDATVRINLYARLARLETAEAVAAFGEELEDRFGAPPQEAIDLLDAAKIRALARAAGIIRIDAGPKAVGFSFQGAPPAIAPPQMGELELTTDRLLWRRRAAGGAPAQPSDIQRLLEALVD